MAHMRDWRRDDRGLSLVEMLVALLVLAVVFAALGAFLITSVAQQYNNELRTQGTRLAQQSIEDGRALPWELTGFYADDAQAASCGTTGGPVVTLAVPPSPAPKSPRVPTAGAKTLTVDGTTYTRTVCIRWTDDPGDGTGSSDADGDTKDVKRIEATVTWQVKGQARTYTAFGLRAPTANEVAPKTPGGAAPFGIVSVTPDPASPNSAGIDNSGKLTAPLTFTATTTPGVSIVQVRWTDANGTTQTLSLAPGTSVTSWTGTLPAGAGPFAPILTTFTFSANSPTGEVSNSNTTVAFSTTPGSLTIEDLRATPNSVDVNTAGMTAAPFTVVAKTSADITSAVLRYTNRSGALVTIGMALDSARQASYAFPAASGPFPDGVVAFNVSANGLGGTATSSTNVTFVAPAIAPVAVLSGTVSPSLCVANNDGSVLRTSTVTVKVQGLSQSDDVALDFNDVAATKRKASFVVQGGTESTWSFTIPTATGLSWKNKSQLSVSVLATRKSDNTQATTRLDSTLFEKNGGSECPVS